MDGSAPANTRSPEDIFIDYRGRRAGLIKALTTDVEEFFRQCNPDRENLCLYGHPNQQWEVNLPSEEVPPELPEPVLGINFARDGMIVKDWISLVAIHSDAWLLALAYYFAARFGFNKADRKRLFNMINDLPTVFEVVNQTAKKQSKVKSSFMNKGNNKSKPGSVRGTGPETLRKHTKEVPQLADENDDNIPIDDDEEDDDEEEGYLCRACGKNDSSDDFWICCDMCEKWFHGSCVKITPAKAETIKHYKCPSCSSSNNKRARV